MTPGKQLIENYNKSNPKKVITISNECYAEINVGLIKAGIKHTTKNQWNRTSKSEILVGTLEVNKD